MWCLDPSPLHHVVHLLIVRGLAVAKFHNCKRFLRSVVKRYYRFQELQGRLHICTVDSDNDHVEGVAEWGQEVLNAVLSSWLFVDRFINRWQDFVVKN